MGYRLGTGAGFGLRPDAGATRTASGILYNPLDNLSYASWAQQARSGRLLFHDLYTTDPHPAVYANPCFWLAGWIARATGWAVPGTLQLMGLVAACLCVVASYGCARRAGLPVPAARWGTLFVAFASGLSAPLSFISGALGGEPVVGADVGYQDAIGFSTFLAYPFHSVALAAAAVAAWLACGVVAEPAGAARRPRVVALFAATALVGTIHPYEALALFGAAGLYALEGWRVVRAERGARTAALLAIGAAALPAALYALWVATQPVWDGFAARSLSIARPRSYWLVGYGLLLPLALGGVWMAWRDRALARARLLAFWLLPVALLLVVFGVENTRISNGAQLPMALLAGLGWQAALLRARRAGRALATALLALAAAGLLATSAWLLAAVYAPHRYDPRLLEVLRTARPGADAAPPAVLTDLETAALVPGLAGLRVYAAHWALTPDFVTRARALEAAGLVREPARGPLARRPFERLLAGSSADFLLVLADTPGARLAAATGGLEPVAAAGPWQLYRLHGPP